MKEKGAYSFESIILQLLRIYKHNHINWKSSVDDVCINLTSVDCVYISVSIWQYVYQSDLSSFVYQCLHLTVCVSNWPQLIVCIHQFLHLTSVDCVSPFDGVCIKLTSVECENIYQCLHLTVCVSLWPQLTVYIHCISVSPFDSVQGRNQGGGCTGCPCTPHFKLKILKPLSVRRLRPLDPHPGSSMDLKHPPTQWKC